MVGKRNKQSKFIVSDIYNYSSKPQSTVFAQVDVLLKIKLSEKCRNS